MDIGILYDDFSRVWVPMSELHTPPKDSVLTITLTHERGNRRALIDRMWSRRNSGPAALDWYGDDKYAIGVIGNRLFTKQWADEDEYLLTRPLDNSPLFKYEKYPTPILNFPREALVHIFTGAPVTPEKWRDTLSIFKTEMF